MFPTMSNPPTPCITRWGTWIEAAIYYCDNFNEICKVLEQLNDEDAESIRCAKILIQSTSIKSDLVYIKNYFKCISSSITQLETKGLPINESLSIVQSVKESIECADKNNFIDKFNQIIGKNTGLKSLMKIKNNIYSNKREADEYVDKLSPSEMLSFKFAPVTSTDVERVFSIYSTVLCNNRRSFIFDNLKKHMIILCNKNLF